MLGIWIWEVDDVVVSDEPRFKVLEAIEKSSRQYEMDRFLREPRVQTAIGGGIKAGATSEMSAIKRRKKDRLEPALFPEMIAAEEVADAALEAKLVEQWETGDRMVTAGRRRASFKAV